MPTTTVPTDSTYEAPFQINDRTGDPISLSSAAVKYSISERSDGRGQLFAADETDSNVVVEPDGETGRVLVTVPADSVDWTGSVFEELRVSIGAESLVVSQRSVRFEPVATASE